MGKYLMIDTDLSSLVIRAQTGDHIAYDGIVRRFQDMAVGYASALLGDFHLAEDAASTCIVPTGSAAPFCTAARKRAMLRRPASFWNWEPILRWSNWNMGDTFGRRDAQGAGGDGAFSIGTRGRSSRAGRVALGTAALLGGEGGIRGSGGVAQRVVR